MKRMIVMLSLMIAAAAVISGCSFVGQEPGGSSVQEPSPEQSAVASSQPVSEQPPEVSEEPSLEPLILKPDPEDLKNIPDYDSKYYVKKLSDEMQYHFITIYKAAASFEKSVELAAPLSDDDVLTLMYLINYDCPELIHVGGDYGCEYDPEGMVTTVSLTYCIKQEEYAQAKKSLETVKQIVKEKTQGKDQLEAEKTIFDMLFYDCVYREDDITAGSIYGALVKKVARCEGYSKAFTWCMRLLGNECMCVVGAQHWNTSVKFSNHSWNVVKIGEEYYNVDVAADNVQNDAVKGNAPLYGFFNTNDDMTYYLRDIDNIFKKLGVPECDSVQYNYHIMNGLYISKGQMTEENIYSIFDRYFTQDGFSGVSIKCEAAEDYKDICARIKDITDKYLKARSAVAFTKEYSYNTISQSVLVSCYHAAA